MARNLDHIDSTGTGDDKRYNLWYVDRPRPESWRSHPWGLVPPACQTSTVSESETMTAGDAFRAAGGNFSLSLRPLFCPSNVDGEMTGLDYNRAVVRDDTGAVLGVVGDRYSLIGNDRIATLLDSSGFRPDSLAIMAGGAKGYAQMLVSSDAVRAGDTGLVASFLTAMWAHDGSGKLRLGRNRTGIVCINTYGHASTELDATGTAFRHSSGAHGKLSEAEKVMEAERAERSSWLDRARKMAEAKMSKLVAAEMLGKLYGESGQGRNAVADILDILDKADERTGVVGDGSAWDVFQALTFRDSHARTVKGATDNAGMADAVRRVKGSTDKVAEMWGMLDTFAQDSAPIYQTVSVLR